MFKHFECNVKDLSESFKWKFELLGYKELLELKIFKTFAISIKKILSLNVNIERSLKHLCNSFTYNLNL